jgi:retron-type reverse transcriptase
VRSPTVTTKLQRLAAQAACDPERVFTTLAHRIDVDFLREAYRQTSKSSASGLDGVTAQQYAEHLDENLRDLHERLCSGRYQAVPVERVWIEKEAGGQRPIGKPTFEDKIVQRAVAMLVEAIYEQDFYDCSYGFRPGRSAHEALHELRERCMQEGIGWIVDADISGYVDSIDRTQLRTVLRKRVNDGRIIRLIGKWLRAGVMEAGGLSYPETGVVQGGVISPVLANVFLHQVLDEWFERDVRPRLKGRAFLLRFADAFCIGCELEADARQNHGRAAQAVCPLCPDHSSDEDGADSVSETGRPRGVRHRGRHIRVPRIDPLLGEIAPGLLGDQTPDSAQAPTPHQEGVMAVVSHPSSRASQIPVSDARSEVVGAFPILWYPREPSPAGRGATLCGESVALLAESSQ